MGTPSSGDLLLPAGAAPLKTLNPRQCVVIFERNVMHVEGSSLWLDNVHFRFRGAAAADTAAAGAGAADTALAFDEVINASLSARVWMTNVTMQGDGTGNLTCSQCGMEVAQSAAVYAEGAAW